VIPSQLVENVGFNGCFSVKTWRSNDGFLGDGSFAAGIRPRTCGSTSTAAPWSRPARPRRFEIVRTFFIKVDDDAGWDQATEIIERAMTQLDPGTPADGDRSTPAAVETPRDLLEDLAEVLDDER
jgi:S-DNA-T family DNA segregation ATPase FtsK/SpoIIIE